MAGNLNSKMSTFINQITTHGGVQILQLVQTPKGSEIKITAAHV